MSKQFKFALGAFVVLETSRGDYEGMIEEKRNPPPEPAPGEMSVGKLFAPIEAGTVTARADYADGREDSFCIRYRAADGCQREEWWGESAIFEPDDETAVAE